MITNDQLSPFNANNPPTWKQLRELINFMDENQLNMTVIVELNFSNECLHGWLDVAAERHDSLDVNVPIIRCDW